MKTSRRSHVVSVCAAFFLGGLSLESEAAAAPICDGRFHFVPVDGALCMDGTPTGFEYACLTGSATSPLLVALDGGGACWDGPTCDCQPGANGQCTNPFSGIFRNHFDIAQSNDGALWADTEFGQTAFFAGPTSPFNQSWNLVHIPYCTGDSHGGDAKNTYPNGSTGPIFANHHGYRNITLFLSAINSIFPQPSRVAVYGSSAGGLGVDCNLSQFRATWPQPRMYSLNNAGAPLEYPYVPFVSDVTRIWGLWHPDGQRRVVADTCPIEAPAGATKYDISYAISFNHLHLGSVRKAFTDDYSDGVMTAEACLMGAPSCTTAVANSLNDVLDRVITTQDPNYRVYYHQGDCHSEREQDGNPTASCDFDQMRQNGMRYADWVSNWINDKANWRNVR